MKSKIAKVYELLQHKRGLNQEAAVYLVWFSESVNEENEARFEASNNKAAASTLINHANQIRNWRNDVDDGHRTIEEYNKWLRMARLYKYPEVLNEGIPGLKPSSGDSES